MQAAPYNCSLEAYFASFRHHITGQQQRFETPYGVQRLHYADWTASGRAYDLIEDRMRQEILPFVGNTHSGTTITGSLMSDAYEAAKRIIKTHVHANDDDVLLFCGSGTTHAVNKLQRLLGLRIPERTADHGQFIPQPADERPVVFVTHLEHHSNHTSWLETLARVEIIRPDTTGNVDLQHLDALLEQYKAHPCKIAAVTACSNVTGIQTPYHTIAQRMHAYGGWCFVDFACAAPYCAIDMHPETAYAHLDAIYFSGHKFLGGPGTPGVLIFNKALYRNAVPDQPGGGTVQYTNPWGDHDYVADIETREDGGTPPFLQGIKTAMCIRLKEAMCTDRMQQRERELLHIIFDRLPRIPGIQVLAPHATERLGVVSFVVEGAHYNLVVRLLNDRFGIQLRGGCSCAGTYGHLLLKVDEATSYMIRDAIRSGDLRQKPGWVRLSIHPVMTDKELHYILDAIAAVVDNMAAWEKDYCYDAGTNEYQFSGDKRGTQVQHWFERF